MQIYLKLISQLVTRGYDVDKLRKIALLIGNTDRDSLLPYKKKLDFFDDKILFFKLTFDYSTFFLKSVICSSFQEIIKNFNWLSTFKLKTVHTMNSNLGSSLIHNLKNSFTFNIMRTCKCNDIFCRICNFIYDSHFIKLDSGFILPLFSNANCNTNNLVYIILCIRCMKIYVGETKNSLKTRIYQHLYNFKNFIPLSEKNSEVTNHFMQKGHSLLDDFRVCVFKNNLEDILIRQSVETGLIYFLNKFNNK